MKLSLLAVLFLAAMHSFAATPANKPTAAAASAPTTSPPLIGRTERPVESPAARAANSALEPGKLRPENQVLPQIVVPFGAAKDGTSVAESASHAVDKETDEQAARCAAQKTKAQRARCKKGTSKQPQ